MASRDPERERQWRAWLTEWQQSKRSVYAFCKARKLHKTTFAYWQKKLGFARAASRRPRPAAFAPLTLIAEPMVEIMAGGVRSVLGGDPLSGDLFVFKYRRGDRLIILAWMGDGFALYLRRLERGTFAFPTANAASVLVTPTQLAMILGGLDPAKATARKRYAFPNVP